MQHNISLYCVPLAWFLAVIPRAYSLSAYKSHTKAQNLDAVLQDPRFFKAVVVAEKAIPPLIRGRIIRAENAMLNGAENLGLFAAGVALGNAAGLDVALLNRLALLYLVSRAVYIPVYIRNDTARSVPLRTAVFAVGLVSSFALWICSGLKYNQGNVKTRSCLTTEARD